VFSNLAKIRGTHSYLQESRLHGDIGCIFMTLSEHSAPQVEGSWGKVHAVLMRDFSLPHFTFARDTQPVKILVIGVPLADTGSESVWKLEDSTNDKVYDSLRTDLEHSNPGIITVG